MDMTLEEQGAYRNLLDEAHLRGGPLPNDERILAKACGDALAWPRIQKTVMARFELQRDGWHNETLDEIYSKSAELSSERAESGRLGGIKSGESKRKAKAIAKEKQNSEALSMTAVANGVANGVAKSKSPSPSPSPDLVPSQEPKKEKAPRGASLSPAAPKLEVRRNGNHINGTLDPDIADRAARFCERYSELYIQHRKGARYLPKPNLDWTKACELCSVWPNDRLELLATVFLKTDHDFAASGSRTIGQFAALASWCDDRLREVETSAS